jgi:hypothetical protein
MGRDESTGCRGRYRAPLVRLQERGQANRDRFQATAFASGGHRRSTRRSLMARQVQISGTPAEIYEQHMVPAIFARWAPDLVETAGVRTGERALDVASGTGLLAELVGPRARLLAWISTRVCSRSLDSLLQRGTGESRRRARRRRDASTDPEAAQTEGGVSRRIGDRLRKAHQRRTAP